MLAMLLAMAFCRAARPATATRSEAEEMSLNTAAPWGDFIKGADPWLSYLSDPCSYPAVRPARRSAEREQVAGRLHAKTSRTPRRDPGRSGGCYMAQST